MFMELKGHRGLLWWTVMAGGMRLPDAGAGPLTGESLRGAEKTMAMVRCVPLRARGISATMVAGSFHPPFSFRSCRKENGPWTVQKKRTLAQTCTCVQVCLNTGVVRIGADKDKGSPTGRDILRQFRFSASAADTPAETSGRARIPCPPGPVARCPSTALVAAAKRDASSIRAFPGPEVSPRATRLFRTDGR